MPATNLQRFFRWGPVAAAVLLPLSTADAQLVINEVFENVPGFGNIENHWEYIELYGTPNLDLTGYILVVIKGGMDVDRNGVPEIKAEIDEAFNLDGCRLSPDGFFTVVNCDDLGRSLVADRYFAPNAAYNAAQPAGPLNSRWMYTSTFKALSIPSEQAPDRLDHDGSSTYMLIYARPTRPGPDMRAVDDQASARGSINEHEGFRKGVLVDENYDGQLDVQALTPNGLVSLQPFQMVDEFAWSSRAGHEYNLLKDHEISETHGLNPDAVSRVAYYANNPLHGHRTRDRRNAAGQTKGFEVLPTTIADESFVYGVLDTDLFPDELVYFYGYDLEGWAQLKGPTDLTALPYVESRVDPEPDEDPIPPPTARSASGKWMMQDIDAGGFVLTPGKPNDHPAGTIVQHRFIRGDINFDGRVDRMDLTFAQLLEGADLLATLDANPNEKTYRYHGAVFQQVLALIALSNEPGESDSVVSQADFDTLVRMVEQAEAANKPAK